MCRRFPTFSIIVKIRQFASYLCSDGKEMYKKVCCTCKVVVIATLLPNSLETAALLSV